MFVQVARNTCGLETEPKKKSKRRPSAESRGSAEKKHMAEEFIKYMQYFAKPERKEKGLTATSASFLAGLASQEVNRLEKIIKSASYYDAYLEPLAGGSGAKLVQKGKDDAFLKKLLPTAKEIGELRGFIAYVHEAVREKERQTQHIESMNFERWLELPGQQKVKEELEAGKKLKKPDVPEEADADWAKHQLSVKELAHYLLLEARASTLGVYIHPDGVLAKAKDSLSEKTVRPIEAAEWDDATAAIIRSFKPSATPDAVYANYNALQAAHRRWEAELNGLKAKLDILAKNENLRRNREYREKLSEHRMKTQELETRRKTIEAEYADWLIAEHEAVRNLKIIIPNELQPVYDRLAALGGE